MGRIGKTMATGALLGALTLAAASPAAAEHWRRIDRGDRVAAGVAGLAIGAGLASAAAADRDGWYRENNLDAAYDDGFYRAHGYYPADGYYGARYWNSDSCRTEDRYDSYTGERIKLRTCH